MTIRPMLLLLPLLLLGTVAAQDVNTMTEAEIGDYITQFIAEQQAQIQQQPVVVQIKSDEALNQKVDLLISELAALKNTNERMQEKFTILASDFDTKLKESEVRIAKDVEDKLTIKMAEQTTTFKDWVREQTNPVRMNLPAIGVFLMATAMFLIFIARTYSFKGKETALVPKKEEKSKKEIEKEKKEQEKKLLEEKIKAEKDQALKTLLEAQKIINEKIEAAKNA